MLLSRLSFPAPLGSDWSSRPVPSMWETAEGRHPPCSINSRTEMKDQGPEDARQLKGELASTGNI